MTSTSGRDAGDGSHVDKHIGKLVREGRCRCAIEAPEMARILGVSMERYMRYELGILRIRSPELVRIAECLGVSVAWFFIGIPIPDRDLNPTPVAGPSSVVKIADFRGRKAQAKPRE